MTSPWRSGSHTTRGCHVDLDIHDKLTHLENSRVCVINWKPCLNRKVKIRGGDCDVCILYVRQFACHTHASSTCRRDVGERRGLHDHPKIHVIIVAGKKLHPVFHRLFTNISVYISSTWRNLACRRLELFRVNAVLSHPIIFSFWEDLFP